MGEMRLGAVEARFAEMIWNCAPVSSSTLAKLAETELNWKKSTTYTVLKRLCDRGIFQNNGGTVTVLVSKEDFYAVQSERFVEETFSGSLPAFLAAFGRRKRLTDQEIAQLQEMIDEMRR